MSLSWDVFMEKNGEIYQCYEKCLFLTAIHRDFPWDVFIVGCLYGEEWRDLKEMASCLYAQTYFVRAVFKEAAACCK